jgi:hypothetical protein
MQCCIWPALPFVRVERIARQIAEILSVLQFASSAVSKKMEIATSWHCRSVQRGKEVNAGALQIQTLCYLLTAYRNSAQKLQKPMRHIRAHVDAGKLLLGPSDMRVLRFLTATPASARLRSNHVLWQPNGLCC